MQDDGQQTTGEKRQKQPGAGTRQQGHSASTTSTAGGQSSLSASLRDIRERINWIESAVAGIGAWLLTLAITFGMLTIFAVPDKAQEEGVDLAIWVVLESLGVSVASDEFVTAEAYLSLDSTSVAGQIVVHMLLPALIILFAGYLLAGRHASENGSVRDTVFGGLSLVVWFVVATVLAAAIAGGDDVSIAMFDVIVTTTLYTLVLAGTGAAIRSQARISSGLSFAAGLGTFVVGFAAWYVLGNPFDDLIGVNKFGDLDGGAERFGFLVQFLDTHLATGAEILPGWYVVFPLLAGAGLAYLAQKDDPWLAAGTGTRLAVGYMLPAAVVLAGFGITTVQEFDDNATGDWGRALINEITIILGDLPRVFLLTGVVYPAVFAGLGGVLGSLAVRAQQPSAETDTTDSRSQQRRQSQKPGQQGKQPQHGQQASQSSEARSTQRGQKRQHSQERSSHNE